jgi:hypothetical protein
MLPTDGGNWHLIDPNTLADSFAKKSLPITLFKDILAKPLKHRERNYVF